MSLVTSDESDSQSTGIKLARFAKVTRLLRIFAVLRAVRIAGVMENAAKMSLSEALRMGMHVAKLLFGMLWLNHIVTCGWFALGRMGPTNTGMRWATWHEEHRYAQGGLRFSVIDEYVTSFHWAVTHTSMGSMEIFP